MDQWYAIVDAGGNLASVGTVIADDATLAAKGLSKIALSGDPNGMVWNASARAFSAPPPPHTVLSSLDFVRRFTTPEFVAIKSSTDANVQLMLYKIDRAQTVTPQDAEVQAGLGYLVQIGILTADRAAVIGAN